MKKTIVSLGLIIITFIGTSAFIKNSSGIANENGAPGESSCNSCHGGGSSAASGATITATPSFTNDEYVPGTTYTIAISVNATGFVHYGFGCEILDDANANQGTMQSAGAGVKFLTSAGRKNAVHTAPKTASAGTATFTFQWVAPDEGFGNANFYVAGNAVNGTGSTNGDFPIAPLAKAFAEGAVPVNTVTTGVREISEAIAQVMVYPNPTSNLTTVSYALKQAGTVGVSLIDLSGRSTKLFFSEKQAPGLHSQVLDLQGIPAGVYFVKTTLDDKKMSQKLITVQ